MRLLLLLFIPYDKIAPQKRIGNYITRLLAACSKYRDDAKLMRVLELIYR